MSIYKITGDPILRHRADEVPLENINSNEIGTLIKQMKNVLRSYNLVNLIFISLKKQNGFGYF